MWRWRDRRWSDGRLITLAAVPASGDRVEVAGSSNGGGGLDMFGGVYVVQRRTEGWKVTGIARAWIA